MDKLEKEKEKQIVKQKQRNFSEDLTKHYNLSRKTQQSPEYKRYDMDGSKPLIGDKSLSSLDRNDMANPFIEKSDIQRHKQRIEQIKLLTDARVSMFLNYSSPQKNTLLSPNLEENFQSILDSRNKNYLSQTRSV